MPKICVSFVDNDGIDLRAAGLVRAARTFRSAAAIVCDGRPFRLDRYDDEDERPVGHCRTLEIRAFGPDAEAAVATLASLVFAGRDGR